MVYNSRWFDCLNATLVTHLSKSCSNHAPLLIKINKENITAIKYFRFLYFWVEHPDFHKTVQDIWDHTICGNPLYVLHHKLMNTSKYLNRWTRNSYGDIYKEPKRLKAQMSTIKEDYVNNNFVENRMELLRCRAEFTR